MYYVLSLCCYVLVSDRDIEAFKTGKFDISLLFK